jgi:hypothetical protein
MQTNNGGREATFGGGQQAAVPFLIIPGSSCQDILQVISYGDDGVTELGDGLRSSGGHETSVAGSPDRRVK